MVSPDLVINFFKYTSSPVISRSNLLRCYMSKTLVSSQSSSWKRLIIEGGGDLMLVKLTIYVVQSLCLLLCELVNLLVRSWCFWWLMKFCNPNTGSNSNLRSYTEHIFGFSLVQCWYLGIVIWFHCKVTEVRCLGLPRLFVPPPSTSFTYLLSFKWLLNTWNNVYNPCICPKGCQTTPCPLFY